MNVKFIEMRDYTIVVDIARSRAWTYRELDTIVSRKEQKK